MQRDARAYLHDASIAAGLIGEFLGECSLEGYRTNALLKSAVERQFEILGEACNQLAKLDPELELRHLRQFSRRSGGTIGPASSYDAVR